MFQLTQIYVADGADLVLMNAARAEQSRTSHGDHAGALAAMRAAFDAANADPDKRVELTNADTIMVFEFES